jgi:hypothetical protein
MKDDIKYSFAPLSPEGPEKLRRRVAEIWQEIATRLSSAKHPVGQEAQTAAGAPTHLDHPPKDRPPVGTFSELLFEKSDRPPHVMPPGLAIALLAVSKLQEVPAVGVNELVADIRRNLDWADAELRSIAITTYSIKHWLQVEMARERVAVFEHCRSAVLRNDCAPQCD